MAATILVVDDDSRLRNVVRYALVRAGFTVTEAADGVTALARISTDAPDLIVLDVMMPEMDGITFCRQLRRTSDVPIVFLSSRSDEIDRVLGLELGGDDYVTKPFSPRELVSRVKAVLRRVGPRPAAHSRLQAGPLTLDTDAHRAWLSGQELVLTATEFRVLTVLMRRPGKAFSREELMARAYPDGHHVSTRTLDSHVRNIRGKCQALGCDAVETVHGLGYRLS